MAFTVNCVDIHVGKPCVLPKYDEAEVELTKVRCDSVSTYIYIIVYKGCMGVYIQSAVEKKQSKYTYNVTDSFHLTKIHNALITVTR